MLDKLDRELVGLKPIKTRIRETAALLLVDRLRNSLGLSAGAPSLHMCFTGNPGTGKTTVALRMAEILHRLGYIRRPEVVSVTRDDLVGQYIGHTAPKTREVLKKAMGGVLFIDEAYYLYRPENERDYGQEAIEMLLQTMENQREDLVVILAGYKERMETFFHSNPGFHSRIAHHLDFPDYSLDELMAIAELMLAQQHYAFDDDSRRVFREYLERRMAQPHFASTGRADVHVGPLHDFGAAVAGILASFGTLAAETERPPSFNAGKIPGIKPAGVNYTIVNPGVGSQRQLVVMVRTFNHHLVRTKIAHQIVDALRPAVRAAFDAVHGMRMRIDANASRNAVRRHGQDGRGNVYGRAVFVAAVRGGMIQAVDAPPGFLHLAVLGAGDDPGPGDGIFTKFHARPLSNLLNRQPARGVLLIVCSDLYESWGSGAILSKGSEPPALPI